MAAVRVGLERAVALRSILKWSVISRFKKRSSNRMFRSITFGHDMR